MLYTKYRPQKFSEIVGQKTIVQILGQSIVENRIAHAYLFAGPRGTGKTSMARLMAKALNCTNPKNGEPCGECPNCKAIQQSKFLDLIEIDAASNRGIEEIRDLKEKIGFLPVEGKYKVYIIDEVHMLTGEAFNALLKTLEEPPQNVIFILATTEAHKLPPTILSRTQRFDFRLANEEDLLIKLEKILKEEGFEYEPEALQLIVQGAMGSFRDSETLLDKVLSSLKQGNKLLTSHIEQVLGYTNSKYIDNLLKALVENDSSKALELFNKIFEEGVNLIQLVKQILEAAREKVVKSVEENNTQDTKEYMQIIKEFNQIALEIKFALVPRLLVEMAILNLASDGPARKTEPPVEKKMGPKTEQKVDPKTDIKEEKKPKEETRPEKALEPIKFADVKAKWPAVINESRNHNHHLVAVLGAAELEDGENNGLIICVPYPFHKDRLSDSGTKKVVQGIFTKIFGHEIPYQCKVDKAMASKSKTKVIKGNEDLVENILK